MNKDQYIQITKWQDSVFTKATALSCINHLKEEIDELEKNLKSGEDPFFEVADCFMLLFGVCNKLRMPYDDIVDIINEKFQVNLDRKWGEVNEQGYVKHIE